MKPKAFDYLRAESLEEAVDGLKEGGSDARILAGGQSLGAMLNMRLVEPELLVDISGTADLDYLRTENGVLEVGAALVQADLLEWAGLADQTPLLARALPFVGHFQTRNRGTVCGSIAHADPSSELPLCLAVLEGEVVLRSASGARTLTAADFQLGMLSTARSPDELVAAVRFPLVKAGQSFAFHEVARRHGDFAIVSVAAMVTEGRVRLGVGGVADRPTVRQWEGLEGDSLDDALNEFAWDLGGYDDIHATARYRRELVRRIGRRVIEEARP
jgi:2-furoyl-CoA dehydrogenase FAD binding subunit